jgi:hypothetical protein
MIIPHIKIVKNLPESFIPALPNVVLIIVKPVLIEP